MPFGSDLKTPAKDRSYDRRPDVRVGAEGAGVHRVDSVGGDRVGFVIRSLPGGVSVLDLAGVEVQEAVEQAAAAAAGDLLPGEVAR